MLGEFWKEADGDQLLLRPGEETIWYYAHEQDKVKRLCKMCIRDSSMRLHWFEDMDEDENRPYDMEEPLSLIHI